MNITFKDYSHLNILQNVSKTCNCPFLQFAKQKFLLKPTETNVTTKLADSGPSLTLQIQYKKKKDETVFFNFFNSIDTL